MAKTVNLGDPYTRRLTLRLSDQQMEFLGKMSDILGVSPSEYIRMTIQMSMVSMSKSLDNMLSGDIVGKIQQIQESGVSTSNENVKTDINDKL